MPEEPEATEAQLRIRWDANAPPPAPTYTNYIHVTYTPEDFTIYFGWYAIPAMNEPPPEGVVQAGVQPVARVTVPLNLMGNFIALMQRQLGSYEENFGQIPPHPNKPDWLKAQEAQQDG